MDFEDVQEPAKFIFFMRFRPRRSGRGASAFLSDEVLEMGDEVTSRSHPPFG
jgi:hypothetical protein